MPRFLLLAAPLAGCGSDADHSGEVHAGDDHAGDDHAAGDAPGRTANDHSDEHAGDDRGSSSRSN
jgi:hypothetical protein